MKNNELKKMLKPLIKQCIKEVIFEEGVLSGIISEVVGGLSTGQTVMEAKEENIFTGPDRAQEKKKRLSETRKKLSEAIAKEGYNGVNVFEGTEPLSSGGNPGAPTAPTSPLSGYAPGDAGVNIDGLFSVAGKNWSKLI
tara:strand:+ start:126 stop:542 length:417 start_codon:yes stop_codon:yes gene_type:complete